MKLKLHHILFAAFTAIAAIPVTMVGLWVQQWALAQEVDAVQEKHLLLAHNLTHALSRYVADVKVIFRNISLELWDERQSESHTSLLSAIHIKQLWITSDDGAVIRALTSDPQYHTGHTPRMLLQTLAHERSLAHQVPGNVVFSSLLQDPAGDPSLVLVTELPDRKLSMAILGTEYVREVQQRIAFGDQGHAAIVDRLGRVMAHPFDSWRQQMKDISGVSAVQAMMQGLTGVTTFFSPAKKADMIAGYTTVPEVGWGVMVPQPFVELEMRTVSVRLIVLGLGLLGLVVAAYIAWRLSGLLAHPIARVAASAHKVAEGEFATRVDLRQHLLPWEMHELSTAFNHMIDQISAKTKALKTSTRRLAEAQRIAQVGNWEWDIGHKRFWHSREIARIFGHSGHQQISMRKLLSQIHPDDLPRVHHASAKALKNHRPYSLVYRITLPDRSVRHVYQELDVILGERRRPRQLMGSLRDITEQKMQQKQLEWKAYHDDLTRLPNREYFTRKLTKAIARAKEQKTFGSLLYVDLDDVSAINNSLGYTAGDQLLKAAAERLGDVLPSGCLLARESGDEFVILAEHHASLDESRALANDILAAFSNSFEIEGYEVFTGCNIGISMYPADSTDSKYLLRCAHIATRTAKAAGRNTYRFFTNQMDEATQRRIAVRNALRGALDRDEFVVHYQPIVNAATGEIYAAEALLRWRHPELGDVSPAEFIPLAEETGVIAPLGMWVLEQSCRQAASWNSVRETPIRLSVNLSARQIQLGLKPSHITAKLREYDFPPELLSLEITENLTLDDSGETIQWLQLARERGIRFSLDDFGTGYSSLSYLTRLPADTLKIDRAFVKNIVEDKDSGTLLNTIIAMAKSLNLKVIVEGVEDSQQLRMLCEQDCHLIQGFIFSKAISADAFSALLGDPSHLLQTARIHPFPRRQSS